MENKLVRLNNKVHVIICGTFPPARTFGLPRSRGSIPALLATPFSPQGAQLKDSPKPIAIVPGDFISRDDKRLVEFVDTLRLSIKARVAVEQARGLSLADIVVQVREMTKLAEEETGDPKPFSAHAFRAISRQAVAWCMEAYQPAPIVEDVQLSQPSRGLL